MTMPAPAQQYPAPPLPQPFVPTAGYYYAALGSEANRVKKMRDARKAYWETWWTKVQAYRDALQPLPPPEQRILLYNRKPLDVWAEQHMKFPRRFEQRLSDWTKLEPMSLARDRLLRALPGREMALEMQMAQQAMQAQLQASMGPPQ